MGLNLYRRLSMFVAAAALASAVDLARIETRVDEAVRMFGVSGRGVLVAILDRGLDWKNNDFRNPDGTTRIEAIFDLSDNTGASDPGNPYKVGTIYIRAQIDAALAEGTELAHRDAVGHGTATTGIATGNGRNSRDWKYRGMAPKATIIVIKIVAGAPAHDDQPAEASINSIAVLPAAMRFAADEAAALGLPLVMLPNLGSVQGPMDGTSTIAKLVDSTVGPGIPGLVFVSGSSDDGGIANHAQNTITQGQSYDLKFDKLDANPLRLDLWYPQSDRYNVTVRTPTTVYGPYAAPATNSVGDSRSTADFTYTQSGSSVTSFGPVTRREILIDFKGAPGSYTVTLNATTSSGGQFDAWLNTVNGKGVFTNDVVPGYTIWDVAAAKNNICPNDYVLTNRWADINGVARGIPVDHLGDLWNGSGIGPTLDGRIGIDVSAPGNTVFTSLAPNSNYAPNANNKIQDGNGFYTAQNAVSGAAPQVTGIIGLMLEMNPTLDASQVKSILQQTARADAFTGEVPNVRWGYGKIDAFAALSAAAALPGAKPYFSVDQNVISIDYPLGSDMPAASAVQLSGGNGASTFTTASSAAWLSTDVAEGGAPAALNIHADPSGLDPGDYSGEITISSRDGGGIPQTVMVHLHVRAPGPFITSVVDARSAGPGFANGSWLRIRGFNLATSTRSWQPEDFKGDNLPASLDGTQVVVFDRPGFVSYVSPNEVTVLAPDNPLSNTRFAMTLTQNGKRSNSFVGNTLPRNPQFLRVDSRHIAALHDDGTLVGPADLIVDAGRFNGLFPELFVGPSSSPAVSGETIHLYATGCGATDPPLSSATRITGPAPVNADVALTIGGVTAETSFTGVVTNGLCRVDAIVPSLPSGEAETIVKIGTSSSAFGTFLVVQ